MDGEGNTVADVAGTGETEGAWFTVEEVEFILTG